MIPDPSAGEQDRPRPDTYLAAQRLQDGRYRVIFTKKGASPRTSYTTSAGAVAIQAERAGLLPVYTDDVELQQACRDHKVPLL